MSIGGRVFLLFWGVSTTLSREPCSDGQGSAPADSVMSIDGRVYGARAALEVGEAFGEGSLFSHSNALSRPTVLGELDGHGVFCGLVT
jgi:hypothetical protein